MALPSLDILRFDLRFSKRLVSRIGGFSPFDILRFDIRYSAVRFSSFCGSRFHSFDCFKFRQFQFFPFRPQLCYLLSLIEPYEHGNGRLTTAALIRLRRKCIACWCAS